MSGQSDAADGNRAETTSGMASTSSASDTSSHRATTDGMMAQLSLDLMEQLKAGAARENELRERLADAMKAYDLLRQKYTALKDQAKSQRAESAEKHRDDIDRLKAETEHNKVLERSIAERDQKNVEMEHELCQERKRVLAKTDENEALDKELKSLQVELERVKQNRNKYDIERQVKERAEREREKQDRENQLAKENHEYLERISVLEKEISSLKEHQRDPLEREHSSRPVSTSSSSSQLPRQNPTDQYDTPHNFNSNRGLMSHHAPPPAPPPDMRPLQKLGYKFDRNGVLRDLNGDKFVFTTQRQYEQLSEAVTHEIYHLLETQCNLQCVTLRHYPEKLVRRGEFSRRPDDDKFSFIFVSRNFAHTDTLLVLFHGTGVVRAGQWARRLIINDSLEFGSQIPYIERALARNWAVVVANTNTYSDNRNLIGSSSAEEHGAYLLRNFGFVHKNIFIVAHSMGGSVTDYALRKLTDEFVSNCERPRPPDPNEARRTPFNPAAVKAVFLTDSFGYGNATMRTMEQQLRPYFPNYRPPFSVNFVASERTREKIGYDICGTVYCGFPSHEMSSHGARDPIFFVLDAIVNGDDPVRALDQFYYEKNYYEVTHLQMPIQKTKRQELDNGNVSAKAPSSNDNDGIDESKKTVTDETQSHDRKTRKSPEEMDANDGEGASTSKNTTSRQPPPSYASVAATTSATTTSSVENRVCSVNTTISEGSGRPLTEEFQSIGGASNDRKKSTKSKGPSPRKEPAI